MAKTLAQVNAQIAKLQKEAGAIKAKEVIGVIERIKEAIAYYGLTAADLGFVGKAKPASLPGNVVVTKKRKNVAKKTAGVIRYRDANGNAWTGRGKRPQWFLAALESGMTPEGLQVTEPASK